MDIINIQDKNLFFIGGVVRDELLGKESFDIDLTYQGDAIEFAKTIDGAEIVQINEPFGTVRIKLNNEEIDIAKVMLMCLIHDIVEVDAGDTFAYDSVGLQTQKAREDEAKKRIFSILPEEQAREFIDLFDEFEAHETAESKFAHAMDNFQPLILNNSNHGSDWQEHHVTADQVYKRQNRTKLGSEKLFEVIDCIIQENIAKGHLKK